MARNKALAQKLKLGTQGRKTRWAPYWAVLKKFGKGKRVHPSEITSNKRSWRRIKIKTSIKQKAKHRVGREIKSGKIKKKCN